MAHLEVPQVALGRGEQAETLEILQYLDEELGTRRYIAGAGYSLPISRRWWPSIS